MEGNRLHLDINLHSAPYCIPCSLKVVVTAGYELTLC